VSDELGDLDRVRETDVVTDGLAESEGRDVCETTECVGALVNAPVAAAERDLL
jgi:hypothetical protein